MNFVKTSIEEAKRNQEAFAEMCEARGVPFATSEAEQVNHPSHYNTGKIEAIEYIEDQKLDFCLGNAVKYISRAGKKNVDKEIEDLEKAVWYINRKIKQLKGGKDN